MPYRDQDRLGARTSQHRISAGGSASWLGAGVMGIAFMPLFGWLAFSGREFSPKLVLGALMMGGLSVWAFKEWWRLRAIALDLHDNGLRYRSSETTTLEITWSEILRLEALYVPGVRKRGTADEGNRISLMIFTASGSFEVPKELEGCRDLWKIIEGRSGRALDKRLVQNLMKKR